MSARDWIEKDFYKVLGVSKDADAAAIKKAYRSLARTHHPDANKGDTASEARFKEVSEAYDVLSDDKKRKEYDEARSLFGSGNGMRAGGSGRAGTGGGFSFDINDLFGRGGAGGSAAGGVGDLFGGLFNRGGRAAAAKGDDLESEITVSFAEAAEGVTLPIRLTLSETCTTCHGSGAKPGTMPRVCPVCAGTGTTNRNLGGFGFAEPCKECRGRGQVVDEKCPTCRGDGRVNVQRTLQVRVPAGVSDGQRIRLKGKGQPGAGGGAPGDLIVLVHVTPDRMFGRSGDNLTLTVPVTFAEAALGATVTVPTLGGPPVSLKIPPGTPSGRTFRVRGKGVRRKDGTLGDLLVTVEVAVPESLTAEARAALEQFAAATPADPRATLFSGVGETA
ncbi:MAG: molecular chaperone DnaJ [Frankiaceae bacterium]|jgi:molecular chaperone DnaJ|nr:molecular chaperone DnaJ [Frankiaceae bacterium]